MGVGGLVTWRDSVARRLAQLRARNKLELHGATRR